MLQDPDYEVLVLLAVDHLDGSRKRDEVLHLMREEMMPQLLARNPEEQLDRKSGRAITWENKASFACNQLKKKGELKATAEAGWGIWSITELGKRRLGRLEELGMPSTVAGIRKLHPDRSRVYAVLVDALSKFRSQGFEL